MKSPKKIRLKSVNPTFVTKKESFDLLIKANLQVFQNHRKQTNINIVFIVFHC